MFSGIKKSELVFLIIVISVAVAVLGKSINFSLYSGNIKMTITQNSVGIETLDSPRKAITTKNLELQTISFLESRMLENSQYGKLGYSSNFFLDLTVDLEIKESAMYDLAVISDDGFRLKIDGNTVCEFPTNRPMQSTKCTAWLESATHTMQLSYFQGGGPLGLQVLIKHPDESSFEPIGEDTDYITYKKSKN